MRKEVAFWTVLVAAAAALAASASLLVDYVRPAPVFCGDGGGCGLVKRTAFAYPLGIPMPVFGLLGFLAIALLALVPGRRARIAQAGLATVAAVVAAMLLVVQAILHTICPFCAVVDGSALVVCALSVLRLYRDWDPPEQRAQVIGAAGLGVVAVLAPLALGFTSRPKPPPIGVPDIVRAEMTKSPAGVITVIDFADYECPFCRATHAKLAPVLAEHRDHVRVVRKNVPLRMHPHAADMARTACCAELAGKGDEMAEALFAADPATLTPEGCEKLARDHGLDITKFRACFHDPKTDASIQADTEALRDSEPDHRLRLPTLWVGAQKLQGEQDDASLREAFNAASRAL